MEYAKLKPQLKEWLHGIEETPVVYVISQGQRDRRCKVGLSTRLFNRMSTYRTSLLTVHVHMLIFCRLSLLNAMEKECHTLLSKKHRSSRLRHTALKDKVAPYSEWFTISPSQVVRTLSRIETPAIAAFTVYGGKLAGLSMPRQDLGAFNVSRAGRELRTRTVKVTRAGIRYDIPRVSRYHSLAPAEIVALYRLSAKGSVLDTEYDDEGEKWVVRSVGMTRRGEPSVDVQRKSGGKVEWMVLDEWLDVVRGSG
jgi:hypothetical protein